MGDLYVVKANQLLFGQEMLNVYFYEHVSGVGATALDLASAFDTDVLSAVVACQVNDLTYKNLDVENTADPSDYTVFDPSNNIGLLTGDPLPPYAAWAFRINRATRAVRNGQKRIAGPDENQQSDGVADPAFVTSTLNPAAAAMALDIVATSGSTYRPRIARRNFDSGGHFIGYTPFPISGVQYVSLSTQNTRKYGRGA